MRVSVHNVARMRNSTNAASVTYIGTTRFMDEYYAQAGLPASVVCSACGDTLKPYNAYVAGKATAVCGKCHPGNYGSIEEASVTYG